MLAEFKKVLVTGGCGFLGHHLVNALLRMKKCVFVLDNAESPMRHRFISDVAVYKADVRDAESLRPIVEGADLVFHLAGNSSGSRSIVDPDYDRDVNTLGTKNVAEAVLGSNVRRFIYVSSAAVYGRPKRLPVDEWHQTEPFTPYGMSKLDAEGVCRELYARSGLQVVLARPFCVYGEGENPAVALCEVGRYLRWHCNGEVIQIVGDKIEKTRDYVSVKDCVYALLIIAEHGTVGEIYNIGTGCEVSMLELVIIIEQMTGNAAMIREIAHIRDDTFRLVADISRIRKLGYEPQISLAIGIRDMLRKPTDLAIPPRNMTIFSAEQVAETFR